MHRHLVGPLFALCLAACGTTSQPASTPAPTAPEPCAPTIGAASKPEPAMPAGLSGAALRDFLIDAMGEDAATAWYQWLTDSWPAWAREGWRRVDQARAVCAP